MQDFTLVYRDLTQDGQVSPWCEVPGIRITKYPLCALWNPGRRHTKAMLDITKDLMQLLDDAPGEREIQITVPYLALLNYVAALPRLDSSCSTQFALVTTKSSATAEGSGVIFASSLHSMD
ncbi:hypothetical protein [Streptomyces lincolnensis]|uniref:hypothetical protein n=1 Tax=Streptomyces lincolnensis TaxID=1915 RepID=UPI0037CE3AAF